MARRAVTIILKGLLPEMLFGYHVSTTVVGLLTHPYKTVQDIVREKLPGTPILFPILFWVVGMFFLRLFDYLLFPLIPCIGFWWFLFIWWSCFLAFWQILLGYLYLRFISILK